MNFLENSQYLHVWDPLLLAVHYPPPQSRKELCLGPHSPTTWCAVSEQVWLGQFLPRLLLKGYFSHHEALGFWLLKFSDLDGIPCLLKSGMWFYPKEVRWCTLGEQGVHFLWSTFRTRARSRNSTLFPVLPLYLMVSAKVQFLWLACLEMSHVAEQSWLCLHSLSGSSGQHDSAFITVRSLWTVPASRPFPHS